MKIKKLTFFTALAIIGYGIALATTVYSAVTGKGFGTNIEYDTKGRVLIVVTLLILAVFIGHTLIQTAKFRRAYKREREDNDGA